MLEPFKAQPGKDLSANSYNNMIKAIEGLSREPNRVVLDEDIKDIPILMQQDILQYGCIKVSDEAQFGSPDTPWIQGSTQGHLWVYFPHADCPQGAIGVARIIPSDVPVRLRVAFTPSLGQRYDLASGTTSESGDVVCLGKTLDPNIFWFVRLATGGGSDTPVIEGELWCTLVTPVCNGFDAGITFGDPVSTRQGFNASRAGLGKVNLTSNPTPLPVYEVDNGVLVATGQYYSNLTVKTQGNGTPDYGNYGSIQFNEYSGDNHAALYGFLASLQAGEADQGIKYDYSDVWETTNEPADAIRNDLHIVSPHLFTGFYPNNTQFKVELVGNANISSGGRTAQWKSCELVWTFTQTIRINGQIDYPLYYAALSGNTITWTEIQTYNDYLSHQGAVVVINPQYNGSNLSVINNNLIENRCDPSIPLCAGLSVDNHNIPQFINCETIPFACAVPILKVNCLYRITQQTASPSYTPNSYGCSLGNNWIMLNTVNYIPGSSPNCS